MFSFVWKNVRVGGRTYEDYSVSHSSIVRCNTNGNIIPEMKDDDGNICVFLMLDDCVTIVRLDHLVLCSHFRDPLDGEICVHANGNIGKCRLMDLWYSYSGTPMIKKLKNSD